MDGINTPDQMIFISRSLGIAIGVFVVLCFLAGIKLGPNRIKPLTFSDKFEIGYIESNNLNRFNKEDEEIKELKRRVTKAKLLNELEKLQSVHNLDNKFVLECSQVLISLGEKKQTAYQKAVSILKIKPVKTIEEFIIEAYKNES